MRGKGKGCRAAVNMPAAWLRATESLVNAAWQRLICLRHGEGNYFCLMDSKG